MLFDLFGRKKARELRDQESRRLTKELNEAMDIAPAETLSGLKACITLHLNGSNKKPKPVEEANG